MRSVVLLTGFVLIGAVLAACGDSVAAPESTPVPAATATASPTLPVTPTEPPRVAVSGQLAFAGVLEGEPSSAVYLVGSDGAGLNGVWAWESAGSHAVYLAWSPDGRQLAFFGHDAGADSAGLYVLDADQDSATRVLEIDWMSGPPVWSPDGSLVYVDRPSATLSEGGILAVPTDGSAAPTLVAAAPEPGTPLVISPDGKLVAAMIGFPSNLAVMSVDDPEMRVVSDDVTMQSGNLPAWSPDSRQIAFIGSLSMGRPSEPVPAQLYVVNADGTGLSQMTDHQPPNTISSGFPSADPVWSPDGQQIAYTVVHAPAPDTQQQEIYLASVDGSDTRNLSDDPERADTGPSWSSDGSELAFVSRSADAFRNPGGSEIADIRVIMADGTNPRTVASGVQSVQFEPFMMEMLGLPEWRPEVR